MPKPLCFTIIVFLFFCGCSVIREQKPCIKEPTQTKDSSFFVSVPIVEFSSSQIPYLNIEIEDKSFLVKLDLGFRGDLSMFKNVLDSISSKKFIGEKSMYGIRSKEYKKKCYRIPRVGIGSMSFSPPVVQEDSQEIAKDAVFHQNREDEPVKEIGKVGWELFLNTNLLIDIHGSRIAFCDSLDTLKAQGYAIEKFIKVPLFLDRGLVEIETIGPKGPLRCVLDTGANCNILNEEFDGDKVIDVAIWEPENILEYPFLKVGNIDLGPNVFYRIPIKIPVHIEAILGMELFNKYVVFLDFKRKSAYLSKVALDNREQ